MIDLAAYEAGPRYDGDYRAALTAAEQRTRRAARALAAHRARAVMVVEGWPAGDRAGVVDRIAAGWDPRRLRVHEAAAEAAHGRHFLWPFWQMLPGPGDALLLDGSWYGRVMALADAGKARRALDEINEFEAQLTGDGTVLIKLYVHLTPPIRAKRLADRLRDPWQRVLIRPAELETGSIADAAREAGQQMLRDTDTRWAPWTVIDGNGGKSARIAALSVVASRLEHALPSAPPEPDSVLADLVRKWRGPAAEPEGG